MEKEVETQNYTQESVMTIEFTVSNLKKLRCVADTP